MTLLVLASLGLAAPARLVPPAPVAPDPAAARTPDRAAPDVPTGAGAGAAPAGLTITLAEHLYLADDPVLRGAEAAYGLAVTRPATWDLDGDPVLTLRFAHATGLDPARSRLAVRVGDRELAEVPLTEDNAADGLLRVPIPARALGDHARLVLVATQHRDGACDGPFDPDLWTRIAADSTLVFPGARRPVDASLATLRTPLFDPLGYGPLSVTPVLAGPVSGGTLDAVAELGLAFGRIAEWRGVAVTPPVADLADADGPALLLGTLAELPPLDPLFAPRPQGLFRPPAPAPVGPTPADLTGDQGFVALVPNPADPTLPVLLVTGRTPAGVRNAARAVARADRAAWLTGAVTVVDDVPDAPPPAPRRVPLPFGNRERASFADLGQADATATGLYAAPVVVPVELEGDSRPRPDGVAVEVHYAYGAGLDPALSTLEVRYGGVGLGSVRLERPEGEPDARVTVKIPARLVTPYARIEVAFHLLPAEWATCAATPADHLWGTVFADSVVTAARDHGADLPDLSLLEHRWFPFAGEDGRPVTVELGERADPVDVAAALQIVATLGARGVAEDPQVSVVAGRSGPGARILLRRGDLPHPTAAALGGARGGTPEGVPTVEARQDDAGAVLLLSAPDGAGLLRLATQLGRDRVLERLGGSRAVVGDSGEVAIVEQTATRRVWRTEGLALWRARAQEATPTLVAGLVPVALAAAAALKEWARRRGGVVG